MRPSASANQFTVIVTVPTFCGELTPAPLACTVIANTTGGGGGGPLPLLPPPPHESVATNSAAARNRRPTKAVGLHFRPPAATITIVAKSRAARIGRVPGQPPVGARGREVTGGATAGREFTCTVNVSEALSLAGRFTVVGLKVQVVPLGTLKHWKLTFPVPPLCDVRVMLKLADCPTESVAEVGEMLPLKPGGGGVWI
jgi:hypothetical protein